MRRCTRCRREIRRGVEWVRLAILAGDPMAPVDWFQGGPWPWTDVCRPCAEAIARAIAGIEPAERQKAPRAARPAGQVERVPRRLAFERVRAEAAQPAVRRPRVPRHVRFLNEPRV